MGQNLYVEHDVSTYPCYAWCNDNWNLGFVNSERGLSDIIKSEVYRELGMHNVNTDHQCHKCTLRYLCGGACRAWSRMNERIPTDIGAPPMDCTNLHHRARSLLISAMEHMGIRLHWSSVKRKS